MLKRLVLAALLLGITLVVYFLTRPTPSKVRETPRSEERQRSDDRVPATAKPESTPQPTAPTAAPEDIPQSAPSAGPITTPEQPIISQSAPNSPQPVKEITGPAEELENVQFMVRGYRDVLGENPVGSNVEITKALMGENAKQVKMPLPVGSHLNNDGELTDRWGTPYFFHQLSAKEMEVRSAGPDQKMGTGDDLVTR